MAIGLERFSIKSPHGSIISRPSQKLEHALIDPDSGMPGLLLGFTAAVKPWSDLIS